MKTREATESDWEDIRKLGDIVLKKYRLILEPSGQRILIPGGTCFLNAIRESGSYIPSECGGKGTCGKCKIMVTPIPKAAGDDERHIPTEELNRGIRLACQHSIEADSRVMTMSIFADARILTEGKPTEDELLVDESAKGEYGAAIDIGTTTIVVYLMDLETGQQVASAAGLNPQVSIGEDVITRIGNASESLLNCRNLQLMVVEDIDRLLAGLLSQLKISPSSVAKLSVVGNTAMHHLFLGLDTSNLGVVPYTPANTDAQLVEARDLGLKVVDGQVYCGPLIAGFVGSDITALIISQHLNETHETVLAIDLGTNGELVLSKAGELYACSTAAGSAFEGATISQGMRGQTGAIEHISLVNKNSAPEITVIGHVAPKGLCGSAIVDIVSELRRVNLVSPDGKLSESKRTTRDGKEALGYIVVDSDEHGADERIIFTQKDIRQVQLAKAAIAAGARILMMTANIEAKDLDRVLLAGAFGNYIDPNSALNIGLIPRVPRNHVYQVGNTAGIGAKMMLLSSVKRKAAETIVGSVRYIELAGRKDFQKSFIDSTSLN